MLSKSILQLEFKIEKLIILPGLHLQEEHFSIYHFSYDTLLYIFSGHPMPKCLSRKKSVFPQCCLSKRNISVHLPFFLQHTIWEKIWDGQMDFGYYVHG
jgi:hypothetical protein